MGRKRKDDGRFPDADHPLTDIEIAAQYGGLIERFHEHLSQDPAMLAELVEKAAAVAWRASKHREVARAEAEGKKTAVTA